MAIGDTQDVTGRLGDKPGTARKKLYDLAFGIERAGFISLKYPLIIGIIALVLAVAAGLGVTRIKVDDSLSQLFRSNTPQFKQYEQEVQQFPSNEYDVLVVIDGKDLLARDNLEKLRNFVTDLQLIEGTNGLISMFSARQPPVNGDIPPSLFPDPLPEGEDYQKLVDVVKSNEIIKGKLLSDDGTLTLIVLALAPEITTNGKLQATVREIRQTMTEDLEGSDLKAELSGVPVMQLEIRNAVERDRVLYNAIGFFAGCVIAIVFFRRVSFMIIAAGPPLIAILFALGTLGWLDFRLNLFLNVMTPLIMVISFSDSMQLTFAARDRLIEGQSKKDALRNSILVVGPACVLTHATAALSFTALLFSDSDMIRAFGEAGLISVLLALFTVLLMMPLLGMLLLRREAAFAAKARISDSGVNILRQFCAYIAARMVYRPGLYSVIAILVVGGLTFVYANLEPRYRLADQVPNKEQAVAANGRLDAKLTGANPVDILIEFPKGESLYSPETLKVIDEAHETLEKQAGIGNVWSLYTLQRWLAEKQGKTDVATLKEYVNMLPRHLIRRFISANQDAIVISGRVPDEDSSKILPVINDLDRSLAPIRAQNPGYEIAVTGLSAVAARNSADMINKLNAGLTIEFLFVAAFIGLIFRSFVVMIASILPAIFPVVLSGALLRLTGQGLQFASVVALTVSFGLGLSATIHFLNRMRLEDNPADEPGVAVERATVLVGPALILTSVVLACGLAVTVFSDLPTLQLFGWLSAFAMIAALIADLFILRPTITVLRRFFRRSTPAKSLAGTVRG